MSKQNVVGTTIIDLDDVQHTGTHRFTGGTSFTLVDSTDATKKLQFDLSGFTTGTTTSFAPSSGGAEVTVDGVQTLTNKTLTNPVVNAGSGTVVLPGANPPAQTAEGAVVWDTANDLLTVGTGSTRKVMVDLDSNQTMTGKTLTSPTMTGGTYTRTAQQFFMNAAGLTKAGTTAGWVVAAGDNLSLVTLPASQTGSTLVIPLVGLKVGWIITGFFMQGQIESAGNHALFQAALRKQVALAPDYSDALVEAGPALDVTADTLISSSNTNLTLASPQTITGVDSFYILVTATTDSATDIAMGGAIITCTTN